MADEIDLSAFVADFARAIERVDGTRPQALNQRSGAPYQPGIGPHSEAKTIELVMHDLAEAKPNVYGDFQIGVPYVGSRQSCDICLGKKDGLWNWAIEAKLLRLFGDNGKPNDSMLMHILSPYQQHRSALTDCLKLKLSQLSRRLGILIFGYDAPEWRMDPAIDAFEILARQTVTLGDRKVAEFSGLVHPVHQAGRVFAWEVLRDGSHEP